VLETPSASTDADLLALAALAQAAAVVDALRGDQTQVVTRTTKPPPLGAPLHCSRAAAPRQQAMADVLVRLAEGEFKRNANAMVCALGPPLVAAFMPSQSAALAEKLYSLLVGGPEGFSAPINLLATQALSHQTAPQVHSDFHSLVDIALGGTSDEEAGLLLAAMAAARVVEPINPNHFSDGEAFAARTTPTEKKPESSVIPTLQQVLTNWDSQGA
jgi:hypothetical protein